MAVCTLDLGHPFFVASIGKLQDDPDIQEALREIKKKVELEHTSCGRVVQQFYGNTKFTHLHGKIWKYDWGKSSARGRKSWRMVVVVPDPNSQPLRLIAGAIYSKSTADQLPPRELAEIFAGITNPVSVLAATEAPAIGEFHRVPNGDGQTRSICMLCYLKVEVSSDPLVLAKAELEHRCDLAIDEGETKV
jgi:hypothetical protein